MRRWLSLFIGLIIVVYGSVHQELAQIYQEIVELIVPNEFLVPLQELFSGVVAGSLDPYNLGMYFLHIPIYLTLHLLLVNAIFWRKSNWKLANILFLVIILSIITVVGLSRYFDLYRLYQVAISSFHKLIKLPIILFIVEGGRILLSDIDNKLKSPIKPQA